MRPYIHVATILINSTPQNVIYTHTVKFCLIIYIPYILRMEYEPQSRLGSESDRVQQNLEFSIIIIVTDLSKVSGQN